MEYGYTFPELVTEEVNILRRVQLGEITIRSYQILDRQKDREDKPIARQFAACDLYTAAMARQSLKEDIPGQQILPIAFE